MSAASVAVNVRPIALKYHFKVDNHMQACMVLPLNGFGSTNLILICGQLLFANGACVDVIAGVVLVYMAIEKNSEDGAAFCPTIVAFFLLSF